MGVHQYLNVVKQLCRISAGKINTKENVTRNLEYKPHIHGEMCCLRHLHYSRGLFILPVQLTKRSDDSDDQFKLSLCIRVSL